MVRGTDPVASTTLRPVISNEGGRTLACARSGIDPHPAAGEQRADAVEGHDAPALHEPGQALEELVDHLLLATLADGEVHHGLAGLDAELLGPRHGAHHAGGLEELLGRDTSPVQARPADLVALDHGDPQAGRSPVQGGGVPAGTAADHDDIEFSGFGRRDHLRSRNSRHVQRRGPGPCSSLTGRNPCSEWEHRRPDGVRGTFRLGRQGQGAAPGEPVLGKVPPRQVVLTELPAQQHLPP